MIKKTILLLVTYCLFSGISDGGQKIILGYVDFPPYEFNHQGKPDGILVSIVEMLFEKFNIPLELKYLPFKRAYESAKKGNIDGLFNFYKTKHRQNYFDYSEAVIKNPLVFFVRKDSNITFNTLNDLKGLKIGVINGYTYGEEFDESQLFIIDKGSNSHKSNFKKLLFGIIDTYPCDKLVGINVALENKYMSEFKILPNPLKIMNGHIGFTKGQHQKVIKKINAIIVEMHQKGEIDTIINQYIEAM